MNGSRINFLKRLVLGTLRRQLIVSVAVVHAAMMALFVWDLVSRQQELLLERQTEQAQALTRSVATSSAGWVASLDVYGLQEIVTAQSRYPELLFAMITDKNGRVLAHNDTTRIGQYLKDLPATPGASILSRSTALVDAVNPVVLAGHHIGWVRIGLGQAATAERMDRMTRDGLLYAVAAIAIGSVLAWYAGTRITRKLHVIQVAADSVERGDTHHRAVVAGDDEVAHVALAFNQMLDSMNASRLELEKSEERFDLAMHASSDGLWDWDLQSDDVYYSPRWKAMLGYAEEELENRFETWERLTDPDGKTLTLQAIDDCLSGAADGFRVEFRMRHKQGHWVYILSQATLVSDDKGAPLRLVGTHTDITDKKQKEELIWRQANFDQLTALPNRQLFNELLEREIRQAERNHTQLWLLFLDIDGFKEINDNFGHAEGDKLLVLVAERMKTQLRKSDTIARLGGDEFVMLLPDTTDNNNVDRISGKIVNEIARGYDLGDKKIYISASIGITNYPRDALDSGDLLKYADQSMYAAKREGKNGFFYFTTALQEAQKLRSMISTDLRQAVAGNQLMLHFQPIVDLANDTVHKAETLIRWNHPDKGLISPMDFIPIAEESGVINEIGAWVFDRAMEYIRAWRPHLDPAFQLSINMSPYQLKNPDERYDDFEACLLEHGVSGNQVVIEITEGLLLNKEPIVDERLFRFRDAGIQVAMDDFGTGYSSLAYLKEFDIDYLKVDKSFISSLQPDSSEHTLTEAIILMAHKLGLKVIAEGVETGEQHQLLKAMGCDFAQGYYYSRPIPADEFKARYLS